MKFTKQMFLNGEVVLKGEPDSEVKPEKLINFLRGIDNGRWIGNGKLYYVRESFIKSSDTNPYPELPLVTIDDLLEYGEQKEQWRFKTEAEFKEEYGENWRSDIRAVGEYYFEEGDILFGKPYNGSPNNLGLEVSEYMITNKPLPQERKIKGYLAPFELYAGIVPEGTLFKKNMYGNYECDERVACIGSLPAEIVEKHWQPVYEEETDPLTEAIKLLRDLADLQNGAPLGKQWEEMSEQVDGFLNRWEKK